MKTDFSIIDSNQELIYKFCKSSDDFSVCWKNYLQSNGWSEEEYEEELEKKIFNKNLN
jgi:hypothetical protein